MSPIISRENTVGSHMNNHRGRFKVSSRLLWAMQTIFPDALGWILRWKIIEIFLREWADSEKECFPLLRLCKWLLFEFRWKSKLWIILKKYIFSFIYAIVKILFVWKLSPISKYFKMFSPLYYCGIVFGECVVLPVMG